MHCSCGNIFCILPPYILENILERGSLRQKVKAIKLIAHSEAVRTQRKAMRGIRPESLQIRIGEKQRFVYNADFKTDLPGTLVRSEGEQPSGDAAVDEAYNGAGITFDLFYDIYERNSIDNKGMNLVSSVHYDKGYDNAFWNGEQMIYGDGDEDLPEEDRLFNRFTISVDVIGHELTHGVTQFEAELDYFGQAGALNESVSDVFGSLVKQRFLNQTAAQADWLIGEGLFTSHVSGVAIRSMKDPGTAYDDPLLGKDPQPAHMDNYNNTTSDNEGVHINSGIPNKAFYACAMEIGGYAWEKAGRIWYHALREKFVASTDFQSAADLTYQSAGELYGDGSLEQAAVKKGWAEVGIWINEDSNVC